MIAASTIKATIHQRILEKLKLKNKWTPPQNNDPKHTSKSTIDLLRIKKKWKVLIPQASKTRLRKSRHLYL